MTRTWSLRGRLVRRVVLGASLSWLAGVALAALVIAHEMSELMDQSLRETAKLSLALYTESGQIGPLVRDDSAIRIIDKGVAVTDAPWPPVDGNGGRDMPGWRVYRLTDADSGLVVEVGQTSEWRHNELVESLGWLIMLMLPVLLATLFAVRRAVGQTLRPATGFAQILRKRDARDLSPLTAPDLPAELVPIPQALNAYLDRIRTQIEAERQFATNAAHELRTPIAAASGQAQLIAAGLADDAAAGRLVGALGRVGHLIDRLLHLSRAEAETADGGSCDLVRIVRMVIADRGGTVLFDDNDMTEAQVAADPDALALILRNLLNNAVDHGTGDVRVSLLPGPTLTIANATAPGATFRHGTFEKSPASHGTGLGLAIVARVAETQGIGLDFRMDEGRAQVTLRPTPAVP